VTDGDLSVPISAVYRIKNIVSGRVYVGSSVDIERRWGDHRWLLKAGRHHSRKLQRSWTKHGPSAFILEIIEIVADPTVLLAREQYWISALNATCPRRGLNILPTAGSHLGAKRSPAARKRMSDAGLGKKMPPRSIAHLEALRKVNLGKVMSAESRARMSAAQKARKRKPHSEQAKANMSIAAKKRGMPPEMLEKAWASTRGRKQSAEERARRSATQKKRCSNNPAFSAHMRNVANARWKKEKERENYRSPSFEF
jgi:group I intron endonuclease